MTEVTDLLDSFEEPDFQRLLGGIDSALVIRFFNYFSRFEYALKRIGRIKTDHRGYLIGADWRGYANDARQLFPTGSHKVDRAIEYLCQGPVKQQRHDFSWEDKPAISPPSFAAALKQIPYIRNNLFHGGKYLQPDPVRDRKLLKHSISLMQWCLVNDQQLTEYFNNIRR